MEFSKKINNKVENKKSYIVQAEIVDVKAATRPNTGNTEPKVLYVQEVLSVFIVYYSLY